MNTSIAVKAKGLIASIPVEVFYVKSDKSELIARLSLSEDNLKIILNEISPSLYVLYIDSPIHEMMIDFHVDGTIYYDTTGKKALLFRSDNMEVNFVYQNDGYYLLWTWNANQRIGVSFDDFLDVIKDLTQATKFNLILRGGSNVDFDTQLLHYLQSIKQESNIITKLSLPSQSLLNETKMLAYTRINLSNLKSEFFKTLAKDNSSDIIACAGIGKDSWMQLQIHQMKLNAITIDVFEVLIRLGKKQQLSLSGKWNIKMLDHDLLLQIQGNVSQSSFSFGAGVNCDPPILFGPIALKTLAFYISIYQGKLCVGGYGQLTIKDFYSFGLLICEIQPEIIDPKAFALALGELSLSKLLSLFVGEIPGIEDFDFLGIESFPLEATVMDPSVFNDISKINYDVIQKEFVAHCNGDLGGIPVAPLSSDTMTVMKTIGGWIITDQKTIRHYYVSNDGKISLAPQLYYSMMEAQFLDMTLQKGIFVCLSIRLLDLKANVYFEAIENKMMRALVKIKQLKTPIITLSASDFHHDNLWYPSKQLLFMHRMNKTLRVSLKSSPIETFLSADKKGPTFYLHLEKQQMECYLNAKVAIMNLFEIQALVVFDKSQVRIDTSIKLWGFSIIFKVGVNYADFNNLAFMIYLKIDTSAFLQLVNELVNKVELAVRAFQSKLKDAQRVLSDAQNRVLGLQYQINDINSEIDYYLYQLRHIRWYEFFKAPYYLCVLGSLEIAKGALYVAIGVAYAALEIAKRIIDGLSYVSEGVLEIVRFVATSIGTIFYIKSVELSFSTQHNLSASLAIDMIIFGQSIQSKSELLLEKEKMQAKINQKAHDESHQRVDQELKDLKVFEELLTFSEFFNNHDLDFNYEDATKRLDDALAYINCSSEMMGMMDANFYQCYHQDQPLSKYFDHDMLTNIKSSNQHWQGSLKAIETIDLQPLINATKDSFNVSIDSIQQEWNELHEFITTLPDKRAAMEQKTNDFMESKQSYQQKFENKDIQGNIPNYDIRVYQIINNPEINFLTFFDVNSDYYINPTKEPILDYLMLDLLKNTDSSNNDPLIEKVKENIKRKENDHTYTIRVKGDNK